MNEWKEQAEKLEKLLRLQTYPMGVKVIKDKTDYPEKITFVNNLGFQIAFCQANSMVRKHGMTLGITPADINCWPVHMSFGWKNISHDDQVKFFMDMGYVPNKEVAEIRIQNVNRSREMSANLGLDKNDIGFCLFPLAKAQVKPDLIYIYGNPAQIMRLVQGYVYSTGGPILSSSMAAGACVSTILDLLTASQPRVVLSGNGERVFAMTSDYEMMFAVPAEKMNIILKGLEIFHKHGQRYPVPVFQYFSPKFLKPFLELRDNFTEKIN